MLPVEWEPRAEPLTPVAVAVHGSYCAALVKRLLARDDEALSGLKGLASSKLVLILGQSTQLPWVAGCEYLGKDAQAPSLLLPTHSLPQLGSALLEQALRTRFTQMPLAVLPGLSTCVPVSGARQLDREYLQNWLRDHAS